MNRPIVGYRLDEEGHWVAELACGHSQHVRHDPPWQSRPWVTTPEGREAHLGTELNCVLCDRQSPITSNSEGTMAEETAAVLREMTELLRPYVASMMEGMKASQARLSQMPTPRQVPDLAAMEEKHERLAAASREHADALRAEDLEFRAKLLATIERHNELLEKLAARSSP